MHHRKFIRQIDDDKVIAAIVEAEKRTSGEIRVYVSHRRRADALAAAQRRFLKLGMDKTAGRNAVLVYLVPRSRSFAVIGDTGVHAKCGDPFWTKVTAELSTDLKSGSITDALVATVRKIGDLLAEHFPAGSGGRNELPDRIEGD